MYREQAATHGQERPPNPTQWQVAVHEAAHAVYAHRQVADQEPRGDA